MLPERMTTVEAQLTCGDASPKNDHVQENDGDPYYIESVPGICAPGRLTLVL